MIGQMKALKIATLNSKITMNGMLNFITSHVKFWPKMASQGSTDYPSIDKDIQSSSVYLVLTVISCKFS